MWAALLAATLASCASPPNKAPVEERLPIKPAARAPALPPPPPVVAVPGAGLPADAAKPLPGTENAGKPGYYTVKPGDTMIRIEIGRAHV